MARRGENIHKRKDGRWEGRYIKARTPDRRICWGYIYGTTYAEVKQRLIHKKSEYGGFQLIDAHLTFTELAEAWLQSVKCGLKESTCAHYQYTLYKYVLPILGTVPISRLEENILEQALQKIIAPPDELVNKYDMYIAYAVRKQTPKNYKDYFDKRIHLIEVKNFGRAIDPVKDIAALFEVKKIAAKIKPDVIHLHSSKAGAIGRVAFNGKIPMFYTPHGYSFLMENYKPMKRRMFKLIESVCAKRNCTTISCSVGEHQESLKLTKHATYVNNGINMAELQEIIDKTEKVEHPFTVYTLGRICYQKNPTLFNEIAELLSDVKFVWIGDGELRGELTSKNIEITGWADRTTAIKYAVNADVFLLPSRWEGLPISLLESMYMKKVCVVSNVIGNRDVIHNGENGFVCTKAEDFVKAIEACRGENEKLTEQALPQKSGR